MRALNAIYGIMKSAWLFYQKFVGDLMTIGFELNPYDPCVANKTINGKQLTLVCHFDNIKARNVEAPYEGELFPVDGLIRDSGVIRVQIEPNRH